MATKVFSDTGAEPAVHPGNPGVGSSAGFSFQSGEEQWREEVDLIEVLREVLAEGGWTAHHHGNWLVTDSGLWLRPQLWTFQVHDDGSVNTSTTIEVAHAVKLSQPCFEYQHSSGDTVKESTRAGFEQWMTMDLVVFDDLLAPDLRYCASLKMSFPPRDGALSGLRRRVLLGPPARMILESTAAAAQSQGEEDGFCPCCLFTNAMKVFEPLLGREGTFGLRLFASRDGSGEVQADCRVNGEDCEAGAEALRAYVRKWPDLGWEIRKQYVLIGPNPDPAGDPKEDPENGTVVHMPVLQ